MKVFDNSLHIVMVAAGILLLTACGNNPEKNAVARVGDKYLSREEVTSIIPPSTSHDDSLRIANAYINKWVKQELLLQQAEANLPDSQKNVERELRDYRNSLLTYKYKTQLVRQRMDTIVTNEQIEAYYRSNPEKFKLDRHIIKGIFIKVPLELAHPDELKEMLSDMSEEGQELIHDYCTRYAKKYEMAIDHWVEFGLFNRNLPVPLTSPELFLKENQIKEFEDSEYYYLIYIHEFKKIDDQAPLDYVRENIRNLILNQRKVEFLKKVEETIFQEAKEKNRFTIYSEHK